MSPCFHTALISCIKVLRYIKRDNDIWHLLVLFVCAMWSWFSKSFSLDDRMTTLTMIIMILISLVAQNHSKPTQLVTALPSVTPSVRCCVKYCGTVMGLCMEGHTNTLKRNKKCGKMRSKCRAICAMKNRSIRLSSSLKVISKLLLGSLRKETIKNRYY